MSSNSYSIAAIFGEDAGDFNKPKIIGLDQSFPKEPHFLWLLIPRKTVAIEAFSAVPGITGIWPDGNGVLTTFGEVWMLVYKDITDSKLAEEALKESARKLV